MNRLLFVRQGVLQEAPPPPQLSLNPSPPHPAGGPHPHWSLEDDGDAVQTERAAAD